MIADRIADNLKCPLMSGPVRIITRDDLSGNHDHDFILYKAPCMLEECVCCYTEMHSKNKGDPKSSRKIFFCSYLDIQIGEAGND